MGVVNSWKTWIAKLKYLYPCFGNQCFLIQKHRKPMNCILHHKIDSKFVRMSNNFALIFQNVLPFRNGTQIGKLIETLRYLQWGMDWRSVNVAAHLCGVAFLAENWMYEFSNFNFWLNIFGALLLNWINELVTFETRLTSSFCLS